MATLVVASLASACDSGPSEREYAVPETLCGLEVDREFYTDLFPPGTDLGDDTFTSMPLSVGRCEITLDGEPIIQSQSTGEHSFQEHLTTLGFRDDAYNDYDLDEGTTVDGAYEAMVWPGFAIAGTACQPDAVIHWLTVDIRVEHPENEEESVRVLSELIQPFMQAAVEASVCEPDPEGEYPVTED